MTAVLDRLADQGSAVALLDPPTHVPARHPLIAACRPHQWIKNGLVLAVPFLAGHLDEAHLALPAVAAVIAFVMASSATYLLNDMGDAAEDRLHPVKRHRPIAAGDLSVGRARLGVVMLFAGASAIAGAMGTGMVVVTLGYVLLTTAYSRWLKHVPVVDIVAVAAGFVLRAIAGGVATGLAPSSLFLVAIIGGALFLAIGKRLGEVIELEGTAGRHRAVLGWYDPDRCRRLLGWSLGTLVAAFTVWALTVPAHGAGTPGSSGILASLSVLPFLTAAQHTWRLVREGGGADPTRLLTSDRTLAVCGLLCVGLLTAAIYL